MKQYDHRKIEGHWQKIWKQKKLHRAGERRRQKKFYALVEFPYPSGEGLHVGHIRSYTAMDALARKRRAEGYEVLYPMGWDAFGLPTENYAIKTGLPPQLITRRNTDRYRKQLQALGFSFDWSREINTSDPNYYRWTQWMFIQFFKKGLAYKAKVPINWCPKDKIGLANEEVLDGKCERCGTAVEPREKEQWMLAITKYADRLDKDLDLVDYPESVKSQQRNWIGRREGVEIGFKISNPTPTLPKGEGDQEVEFGYQTTDPKTWRLLQDRALTMRQNATEAENIMWQSLRNNSTGCHFRRQHIIGKFIVDFVCLEKKLIVEVDGNIHDYQKAEDEERSVFLKASGFKVVRFRNDEVTKSVELAKAKIIATLKALSLVEGLGGVYGGVIKIFTTRPETIFGATFVAVAGSADHFTGQYAVNPATQEKIPIWEAEYVMDSVGTGAIMGVPAHDERDRAFAAKHNLPVKETTLVSLDEVLEKIGGKKVTTYKLRDWIFSRQRYWGEPIPIIHCEKCGIIPVPEKDLPVKLPRVKNYQPTDTGESPLAKIKNWVKAKCPQCGGSAKRETDVMPNWAGSSWYYLAYLGAKSLKRKTKNKLSFHSLTSNFKHWLPVDWYNGGMEHTTLHLLYSRFWHKVLYDLKLVPGKEPYQKRTSQGLILANDGEKMSKSRGAVVNPDDIVRRLGADTLRVYEMFMGPFSQAIAWNEAGLVGSRRFLERVSRLANKKVKNNVEPTTSNLSFLINQTIRKVSEDIEQMKFNTALSALMVLLNDFEAVLAVPRNFFKTFLKLLSPFAPHLAADLWQNLGEKRSIHLSPWPCADRRKLNREIVAVVVQVNGRRRDSLILPINSPEEKVVGAAKVRAQTKIWLDNRQINKTIFIPNRLINFVVDNH